MKTIEEIREYLDEQRGRWPQIAEQSGVSYWWITKFMSKKSIPNPGYDKVLALSKLMGPQ